MHISINSPMSKNCQFIFLPNSVCDIQKDINRLSYLQENRKQLPRNKPSKVTNCCLSMSTQLYKLFFCVFFFLILGHFPSSLGKKLRGFIPSIRVNKILQELIQSHFVLTVRKHF